jgi:hypothetical protein
MNVWILIVQPDFQAVGRPFIVEVESSASVLAVKQEVKQQFANTLALDIPMLVLWKTEGEEILDFELYDSGGWKNVLQKIRKTLRVVKENEIVGNLGLSDNQILLVQIQILRGMSRIPTASETFPDNLVHKDQVTAIGDEALVDEVKVEVEETNEYKRISNPLYLIECR